jgi:hypothetical protein
VVRFYCAQLHVVIAQALHGIYVTGCNGNITFVYSMVKTTFSKAVDYILVMKNARLLKEDEKWTISKFTSASVV